MGLSPRRDNPGTDMGQYAKRTSQGITKAGVCQSEQVSRELSSKTIYCLLGSDILWQPVPFNQCGDCKDIPTYVLLETVAYCHE